jgi:hypothetical protein
MTKRNPFLPLLLLLGIISTADAQQLSVPTGDTLPPPPPSHPMGSLEPTTMNCLNVRLIAQKKEGFKGWIGCNYVDCTGGWQQAFFKPDTTPPLVIGVINQKNALQCWDGETSQHIHMPESPPSIISQLTCESEASGAKCEYTALP